MRSSFLLAGLFICFTGCGSDKGDEGQVCTASIDPAIRIEVLDAVTRTPISCGAQAVIEDGAYQVTVQNPAGSGCYDGLVLSGAFEREGTYKVTVTKTGYSPWSVSHIVVTANVCHVNTVTLQALMQP